MGQAKAAFEELVFDGRGPACYVVVRDIDAGLEVGVDLRSDTDGFFGPVVDAAADDGIGYCFVGAVDLLLPLAVALFVRGVGEGSVPD